ncbi:MAG TPA: hypothetical protein PKI01_03105 [Bacteroidales bacterium]|nr:hypothetical protein [Bacteroidales bacterium]
MFCFKTDLLTLRETIKRFYGLKFNIRAAWYEKLEPETGAVIENTRIPTTTLQEIFNEVIRECTSNSIANKK